MNVDGGFEFDDLVVLVSTTVGSIPFLAILIIAT